MPINQSIDIRQLKKFGLNQRQIDGIKKQISSFSKTISRENRRANTQEQATIENAGQKLQDIEDTVKTLHRKIRQKRSRIKKSYREIGFHCRQTVENCIGSAITQLNKEIKQLKQTLIEEKNKELKYKKSPVIPEGSVQQEIASKAISLVKQLQSSHAKVNKLWERTVSVNHEIQTSQSQKGIEINRQIDKYWIYLMPDGQVFQVMAVVKFKIKKNRQLPSLTVNTIPSGTQIRILNINPVYYRGIRLKPGRYHIEVKKSEYKTARQWVTLGIHDKTILMELEAENDKTWTDPITGMEFVWIPAGSFQMGSNVSNDEKPIHKVSLSGYWMAKYELTQGQWQKIMSNNPSYFKKKGKCTSSNCPVEKISWEDVQKFIKKLNQKGNATFRLPTEAEWEYACRSGGKDQKYCGGNNLKSLGWYDDNSGSKTHPVGKKKPNGLGLYDMSGNVWEWVEDWYGENYYGSSPARNPKGASKGSFRVIRGGSWYDNASYARSAYRYWNMPGLRFYYIGVRLVRQP
jgi:formylglycine-generating enzyme required for sulfatase activity